VRKRTVLARGARQHRGFHPQEATMTKRIGNKDIAQHRSKEEKKRIHAANVAMEAEKQAAAREKYRNMQKGQPFNVMKEG
jgi:predicted TIM-barrel fold metal-dependent hydrolase